MPHDPDASAHVPTTSASPLPRTSAPTPGADVQSLFARIAGRYDLLNRVLSARRDVAWRASALTMLRRTPGVTVDLACGTFDFGLQALASRHATQVHGLDFCLPMLQAGASKRHGRRVSATAGDALGLPLTEHCADTVLMAYGWRNVTDPHAALREMRRILVPGGEVLILEFFRPVRPWPWLFYRTYGAWIMPLIGGLLSGDRAAYQYLNDSVRRFLSLDEAAEALRQTGFRDVRTRSFFGGISHALVATRGD